MSTAYTVANVILHVTLLSALIAVLFFSYISLSIEPSIVTNQVDRVVDGITGQLRPFLDDEQRANLARVFNNVVAPDLSGADADARNLNNDLLKKAVIGIGVMFVLGLGAVIGMSIYWGFSLWDLAKENMLAVLVVAACEISFATYFMANYRTLDSNMVMHEVVQGIQNYVTSSVK